MSSRPRIALLVPDFAAGGGVPVVALFLERVLRESGRFDVDVVSVAMGSRDPASVGLLSPGSWFRGVRVTRGEWQGVPFRHVGAVGGELEFRRYRPHRTLTRILAGYDLVQVVAGAPCWAELCRDLDIPVALQVATLVREERKELLARSRGPVGLWRRWMAGRVDLIDRRALDRVDAVFVENQWMYDLLSRRQGRAEVLFAPPGIDTDFFRPGDRRALPPTILSVGRLSDPRKNVRLLFEAYARVVARGSDARLVLAGSSGPTAEDWAVADRLDIRPRVTFHHRVSAERLAALYREATVYALSSDEEGLGLVILESLASATPVVATDCGGPSTSIRDGANGYLVPRGDAGALAARLAELLENPDAAGEMGREGRREAVERFSLAATGRLFLDCYDRLLAGGNGRVQVVTKEGA